VLLLTWKTSHGFAPGSISPKRSHSLFSSQDDETDDSLLSFADLGLSPELLTSVAAQSGWTRPTQVQQLAIPKLLEFGNTDQNAVLVEAPTGSGKTATYALPLLQNLQRIENKGRISALILCPTRELAAQIGSVLTNLANNVSSKRRKQVMVLHGGIPIEPQIRSLADYARHGETLDFLVATPGRLVDVLTYYQKEGGDSSAQDAALERRLTEALDQQEKTDASLSMEQLDSLGLGDDDGRGSLINLLSDVQLMVLDEADRLLGRQFESEFNAVLAMLPSNIPTWMFSATFPKAIEPRLNHVITQIGATNVLKLECSNADRLSTEEVSSSLQKKIERTGAVSSAQKVQKVGSESTIALQAIRLEKRDRTQALRRLLKQHPEWDRVLVFVATRYASEHVSKKLRRAGIHSNELHGKLSQDARERRLSDLRTGKIRVLLATDVASRGLDIAGLPVIFNYDLPRSTADFVHRVGRTGRAGRNGTAISFVTASSEAHMELIESRHLTEPIRRDTLPDFEPDEEKWYVEVQGSRIGVPGTVHSEKGLAHDRMFGGFKGRRKSKKDKLREAGATKSAAEESALNSKQE
jgi:ATP-dependent RNA helicase RhlE